MPSVATPRKPSTKRTPPNPRTNSWLTLADMLHDLGDVAPERVRTHPPLGTATERDLIHIQTHEDRNCELIDGVLVEKIMGAPESYLAVELGFALRLYLENRDCGFLMSADGPTRLRKGLVRMPDISFISWDKMPTKECPATAVLGLAPNLAVEVLSENNRPAEMARKRQEYFRAGVELVWEIDSFRRSAAIYTAPDRVTMLGEKDTLDGGSVLPGFTLALRKLFARLPKNLRSRHAKKEKKK